jgi:uncharacterized protein (DUF4213/DUF364 family)
VSQEWKKMVSKSIDIINALLSTLDYQAPVREILIGVHWTAVVTRNCGLASTPHNLDHHHSDFPAPVKDAGKLLEKDTLRLSRMARSESVLEAAIGMATINSLIEVEESRCIDLNAGDFIEEQGSNKRVAIVGHFPFIKKLRQTTKELWVIEKHPRESDLAESEAQNLIPEADVVAITGSAFVNHTIEDLLKLCAPKAFVIVLGPSTPLSPILFDYRIDVISGTKVIEPETVLRHVSQGVIFRQMKGVRLLTMKR